MVDAPGARAFVPGHVTAFFGVYRRDDPLSTGSRGAGLALTDGIEVAVKPADGTAVKVNGEPVQGEPVERVLSALGVEAVVSAETTLRPGAGFGVSGGLALGTALAANDVGGLGRTENALVGVAHRAEVESGTGLGDVVAQARGGVPIRLEPGAPPAGALDGVPATARLEHLSFGELDTGSVIAGDTSGLTAAGGDALAQLLERPTLPTLFAAGRSFAREADLLSPRVASAIEDVRAGGGEACMAMLGETVVALGSGLSDAGYDPERCRVHTGGASLLPPTRTGDAE